MILPRYALGHFAREEAHMIRVSCPSGELNFDAQRDFARKLEGWLDLLSSGGTPVSVRRNAHGESSAWIESLLRRVGCCLRNWASKEVWASEGAWGPPNGGGGRRRARRDRGPAGAGAFFRRDKVLVAFEAADRIT